MKARIRHTGGRGFTLIEILVVLAVTLLLAALLVGAAGPARAKADAVRCQAQMRQLGTAILRYTQEHDGEFPRSSHSAYPYRQKGWAREILPWLSGSSAAGQAEREAAFAKWFRCPADRSRISGSSYALNVYFELDPDTDDYEGSPEQWRRSVALPSPARTILLAETDTSADHVMAHFWAQSEAGADVAEARHEGRANYLFADGHAESLGLEDTYAPGRDLWNPSRAGEAH
jgi:prepilin-type processing-associated H-X9-DG protein/prepilin-type N-terminal cleavage/methylation domain-containing protein